ncbi:MAG: hypothetical protein KBD15_02665 [Candidatus Magasanikbacteria bacterium]|nr:hypothetical protein [Candidatus Magasanikbacteria bacterium]
MEPIPNMPPSPATPPPHGIKGESRKVIIILLISTVVLLAYIAYMVWGFVAKVKYETSFDLPQNDIPITTNPPLVFEDDVYESGEDTFGTFVRPIQSDMKVYTDVFPEGELLIDWRGSVRELSVEETKNMMSTVDATYPNALFREMLPSYGQGNDEFGCGEDCGVRLYEVGVVKGPLAFAEVPLYYMLVPSEGMGLYYTKILVVLVPEVNKFLIITFPGVNNPDLGGGSSSLERLGWFLGEVNYPLPNIYTYPETIQLPNLNMLIRYVPYTARAGGINTGPFNTKISLEKLDDQDRVVHTDATYGPIYFDGKQYSVAFPDGAIAAYDIQPNFFIPQSRDAQKDMYPLGWKTDIKWNTFVDLTDHRFDLGGDISQTGCGQGFIQLTSIVNQKEWFNESNLIEIGKTKQGDAVYELKDKATNPYYKQVYDFGFYGSRMYANGGYSETAQAKLDSMTDEQKFAEFLKETPVFFWKDPVGNWRVFRDIAYQTLAECGKPVVYLYPQKTTAVNVQVAPNGGFTTTIPEYPENGWNVVAEPNGTLTYSLDGKTYPYLFWEGHANGFGFPEQGFVFAKDTVPTEMRELLYKTGLNKQETEDFMEFWQERMMVKPYVFVTFAQQADFERGAPLTITPKPDTTIRVFMSFTPLDTWKDVQPLRIATPKRHGFTAVEWGGVLEEGSHTVR